MLSTGDVGASTRLDSLVCWNGPNSHHWPVFHDDIVGHARVFSVYFLAEAADVKALKAATPLAAWPGVNFITLLKVVALPDGLTPIMPSEHKPTRAF